MLRECEAPAEPRERKLHTSRPHAAAHSNGPCISINDYKIIIITSDNARQAPDGNALIDQPIHIGCLSGPVKYLPESGLSMPAGAFGPYQDGFATSVTHCNRVFTIAATARERDRSTFRVWAQSGRNKPRRFTQRFPDDPSVHVGQAEVSPCVAVRELLVIEAQQMEDRGVEVVNVHLVGRRGEAELVGGSVNMPPRTPPPASHIENP